MTSPHSSRTSFGRLQDSPLQPKQAAREARLLAACCKVFGISCPGPVSQGCFFVLVKDTRFHEISLAFLSARASACFYRSFSARAQRGRALCARSAMRWLGAQRGRRGATRWHRTIRARTARLGNSEPPSWPG
jgi:hypothetical protein